MTKHDFAQWLIGHATLPMAHTSQVEGRLTAILRSPKRGEVARRAALGAGALTLAALAGLAALRVEWKRPATVDASTPLAQDGFTLRAVQRGDGADFRLDADDPQNQSAHDANVQGGLDGTGLWIQPPALPNVSPDALRQEYRIRVRASNGTRFTLPYGLSENGYPTNGRPALLCVGLPPGYPDSDRYFDVTVTDRHGHRASWRLTNLPQMRHALVPPTTPRSQFSSQGFTIRAEAGHILDPQTGGNSENIGMSLRVTWPKTVAYRWDMTSHGINQEWEPEGTPRTDGASATFTSPLDPQSPIGLTSVISTPYADDIHLLGMDATLRQFETYDETVTFHNVEINRRPGPGYPAYCTVAAPQSVTTPSGITVTLPVLAKNEQIGMPWLNDGIDCRYTTSLPEQQPTYLARSPLCREYRRPVTVQITVAKPYRLNGSEIATPPTGPAVTTLGFDMPRPYPKRITNLTLIVRQRADLQTIPLHFVVPVENAPPLAFRPCQGKRSARSPAGA